MLLRRQITTGFVRGLNHLKECACLLARLEWKEFLPSRDLGRLIDKPVFIKSYKHVNLIVYLHIISLQIITRSMSWVIINTAVNISD